MSPQVYFNGPIGTRFREEHGEKIKKVVESAVRQLCERPLADLPDIYLLPSSLNDRIVGSGYLYSQLLVGLDDVFGATVEARDEVTLVIDQIITNAIRSRYSEVMQHGPVYTNWSRDQRTNTWKLDVQAQITRIS